MPRSAPSIASETDVSRRLHIFAEPRQREAARDLYGRPMQHRTRGLLAGDGGPADLADAAVAQLEKREWRG